jgi:hypothetical protein
VAVQGLTMLALLRSLLAPRTTITPPGTSDASTLLAAFGAAGRKVGRAPLVLDDAERGRVRAAGVEWPLASRLDELWRIALLVDAAERDDAERLLGDCYRGGDSDERCAVLRALPLLARPERFTALAADACRTSVQPIFEALACDNPYPARHLDALHFDQMVLKALFLDVSLARIVGLAERRTPELRRMAQDYARERRAAGRSVSADLAALAEETP